MRDAGITHYPLFPRKSTTCSCALFNMNYCDAGSFYLTLDTDKMCLQTRNKHSDLSLCQNIPCVWGAIATKTAFKSVNTAAWT